MVDSDNVVLVVMFIFLLTIIISFATFKDNNDMIDRQQNIIRLQSNVILRQQSLISFFQETLDVRDDFDDAKFNNTIWSVK